MLSSLLLPLFLLVLLFDSPLPLSSSYLQKKALVAGSRSTITSSLSRATHILLDPDCDQNLQLRSLPPPVFVVNLEFLKDSFLAEETLPEKDYTVHVPVEDDEEAMMEQEEESDDEEEEEEFVHPGRRDPSAWLVREENDLIRFLATNPQKDHRTGLTICQQYEKMVRGSYFDLLPSSPRAEGLRRLRVSPRHSFLFASASISNRRCLSVSSQRQEDSL